MNNKLRLNQGRPDNKTVDLHSLRLLLNVNEQAFLSYINAFLEKIITKGASLLKLLQILYFILIKKIAIF